MSTIIIAIDVICCYIILRGELMSIGENIKQIRKNKGLTQNELAKDIGISRSYLGDLEKNRRNPSTETIEKLSKKLGVSVLYLITGEKTFNDIIHSEKDAILSKDVITNLYDPMINTKREFILKNLLAISDNITDLGVVQIFYLSEALDIVFNPKLAKNDDFMDTLGGLLEIINTIYEDDHTKDFKAERYLDLKKSLDAIDSYFKDLK